MTLKPHGYRAGPNEGWFELDAIPHEPISIENRDAQTFIANARRGIEPWLSAIFQSEHLNLLVGSGFTSSIGELSGTSCTGMSTVSFGTSHDSQINAHAQQSAARMGRGTANIEDQFRSALSLLEGMKVLGTTFETEASKLKTALDTQLLAFLRSLLETERGISSGIDVDHWLSAVSHLQSFLLSFASRAASRERLHVFTTNYDRLIEYGCDLAGLRVIDRFVGSLSPVFRSSRVEVDVHYNPPGIRGEPRFLEGVLRLSKLHGSLDWHFNAKQRAITRIGMPFGAAENHSDLPKECSDTVMIYPNPAKDVETTEYPYAELFRDFASALCRPNSVAVTYGYGFGDDHVNRVLSDMLTIPSAHLVVISYTMDERVRSFLANVGRPAQITLLIGSHFANIRHLVAHYLPKPALDYVTGRMNELLKHRGQDRPLPNGSSSSGEEEHDWLGEGNPEKTPF